MISKWLFSGAFLFELSSWASVFADLPFGQALALYLFAHGLGSALLCVGVWLLLPRRYKFPLPWSPLFLFSLAFFVPLIGAVGVAAAVFPALTCRASVASRPGRRWASPSCRSGRRKSAST